MAIPWRVARALLKLRDQLKAAAPAMSNPGFIGDAAHASRASDHNPWIDDPASPLNVVSAGDVYHQPAKGMDAGKLAEALRASRDPRIKYVIWNRRIFRSYDKVVSGKLVRAWQWAPYYGDNPHTGHCHVSVSSTKSLYDNTRAWALGSVPLPRDEDDEMTPAQMEELKEHIDYSTNAAARRWALWAVRYDVQTADERAKADQAYQDAIDAGKSPAEAMSAVVAIMRPLDEALAADQKQ